MPFVLELSRSLFLALLIMLTTLPVQPVLAFRR
jgi:hypothetical protein